MKQQNYSNHVRYYIPHHFVFYGLITCSTGFSLYMAFSGEHLMLPWAIIAFIFVMIGWLSFMLRQHYALMNQNRIVRLEMRLRYYVLTQKRFEELEKKLSFGQVAALRFAADEELPGLIERTLSENLSPADIKKAVRNWQADNMRV